MALVAPSADCSVMNALCLGYNTRWDSSSGSLTTNELFDDPSDFLNSTPTSVNSPRISSTPEVVTRHRPANTRTDGDTTNNDTPPPLPRKQSQVVDVNRDDLNTYMAPHSVVKMRKHSHRGMVSIEGFVNLELNINFCSCPIMNRQSFGNGK